MIEFNGGGPEFDRRLGLFFFITVIFPLGVGILGVIALTILKVCGVL